MPGTLHQLCLSNSPQSWDVHVLSHAQRTVMLTESVPTSTSQLNIITSTSLSWDAGEVDAMVQIADGALAIPPSAFTAIGAVGLIGAALFVADPEKRCVTFPDWVLICWRCNVHHAEVMWILASGCGERRVHDQFASVLQDRCSERKSEANFWCAQYM